MSKQKEYVDNSTIIDKSMIEEMKSSLIDYSMSTLTDRAIPSVLDGCKPIHRRIIYDMSRSGATSDHPYKKVARLVGSIMGKLHAHGDSSIEGALVRFAQDWNMRYPLVDGHGNFGSVDGDPAAAARYIEARLTSFASEMTKDITKDVVDFVPNFDGLDKEPVVLPCRFPNVLVNPSFGIAVGYTSNIPSHNLTNVIDACVYMIDTNFKKYDFDELQRIIVGPDFPTGGSILNLDGINQMYRTRQGKFTIRGTVEIEKLPRGKSAIIITELPYGVNKAKLIEKLASLIKERKLNGVLELRDESSRDGMRIYIELKKDVNPDVFLNRLYKFSDLQTTFSASILLLSNGVPKFMALDEILIEYLEFQRDIIRKRTEYELRKAKERVHIVEGLLIALNDIDTVIKIIRTSTDDAKEKLIKKLKLSDIQAQAILDMRLARLQKLEVEKLQRELDQLLKDIKRCEGILKSPRKQLTIVKKELLEIRDKYGDERKTKLLKKATADIDIDDVVESEDCYITITYNGFINRISSDRMQKILDADAYLVNNKDVMSTVHKSNTHETMLFFTDKGNVYRLPVFNIPESKSEQRTVLRDLVPIMLSENLVGSVSTNFDKRQCVLSVTSDAQIKKISMDVLKSNYTKISFTKLKGDALVVKVLPDIQSDVVLVTKNRKVIRFSSKRLRPMGRTAVGVNAMNIEPNDNIVSALHYSDDAYLAVLSTRNYLKKFKMSELKQQSRARKGVLLLDNTKASKFGDILSTPVLYKDISFGVKGDEIMLYHSKDIKSDTRTGIGKKASRLIDCLLRIELYV